MNTSLNAVTGGIRVILTFRVRLIPNIVDPSLTTWSYEPREIILSYSTGKNCPYPLQLIGTLLYSNPSLLKLQTAGMFFFLRNVQLYSTFASLVPELLSTLVSFSYTWNKRFHLYYLEALGKQILLVVHPVSRIVSIACKSTLRLRYALHALRVD